MAEQTLCDILNKYGHIGTGQGTDKNCTHSYGETYEELFHKIRYDNNNILEIGYCGGYGLLSFSEYFPNSIIYGVDIRDSCTGFIKNNSRIKALVGDSLSDDFINNNINTQFDIIIEDASHLPHDQVNTFLKYNKFVKPGGIYIIEDIPKNNLDFVYNSIMNSATSNNFIIKVIDLTGIKNRFDDILIVLTKQS